MKLKTIDEILDSIICNKVQRRRHILSRDISELDDSLERRRNDTKELFIEGVFEFLMRQIDGEN